MRHSDTGTGVQGFRVGCRQADQHFNSNSYCQTVGLIAQITPPGILPISAQIAEPVFSNHRIIKSSIILQFIWQRAARVNFENCD